MGPIRVFNRYVSQRHLTVFAGELLLIAGSMGFVLHHYSPDDALSTSVWKGAVVSALCMLCLYYNDLYDLTVVRSTREVFIRLLQSVGSALILIALLYLVAPWLMVADGASLPAFAIFLTWFATRHPFIAAGIAIVCLVVIVILVRWIVRALRALFRGASGQLA